MIESLAWTVASATGFYFLLLLGIIQFLRLVRKRDRDLRRLTAEWVAQQAPLS